ncbi:uncharacterized protein LOC129316378 [Prosopis cineraria]|uniref:uncharacterized protein LOC129316378 n=1 Tax=Prosopis cineraria TaxID=364024 RepID=UPI00240F6117|nr:uncharacterized protein LOC129316378 [Prosopis cineraria]
MPKDANSAQQFVQLHGEQSAVRSSLVVGPSSWMPSATNLPSGFAMAGSQLVATPIQPSYGTAGNFSNVSARPLQAVGNIHAFAHYPQLYGSLTSNTMPTTRHRTPLRGMSDRLVPSNIPATSLSFPRLSTHQHHHPIREILVIEGSGLSTFMA